MKFIALILLCACGSVQGTQKDADVDSASQDPDAYVPTCAAASFTMSAPVAGINTAADDVFLRLSDDELTAYFATLGTTTSSLYATRASKTVPFDSPNPLPIMGTGEVTSPTVTADGLTLYLISSRSGGLGVGDIWRSTRQSVTATFGTPANVGALNSAADELDVYVLPDNSAVYFSSARTNNVYSIWRAARNGAGFDAPVEVLSVAPGFANRAHGDRRGHARQPGTLPFGVG